MTEVVPTPLQIERIKFVQDWVSKHGHGLFRKDIYGLDIEVELMLMLQEWDKKSKRVKAKQ